MTYSSWINTSRLASVSQPCDSNLSNIFVSLSDYIHRCDSRRAGHIVRGSNPGRFLSVINTPRVVGSILCGHIERIVRGSILYL
jgi:hypothetical protein